MCECRTQEICYIGSLDAERTIPVYFPMSPNPLISVIIPVYNVEKYLRRCLDSICGQTYRNLEILCVNDGSTDGSAAILEEYAAGDSRIKIFTQENAGQAAARNAALQQATGEWVTGVDADDYLDADTIESSCACISDAVDIISFGIQIVWDGVPAELHVEKFYAPRGKKGAYPMSSELLLDMPWEFCSKLWRRSLLTQQKAHFPHGLRYEDWFFFFAYTPVARGIYFMDTQKYYYVRRGNSTMSQAYAKSPRNMEHLQVLELLLKLRRKQKFAFDISLVNLFNFIQTYQFVRDFAPDDMQEQVASESRRIAAEYGLLAHYPARLRFLYPQRWWQQLFVRHRFGKSTYGFGPLKPLAIQYRNADKTVRLFGIKLYKTR